MVGVTSQQPVPQPLLSWQMSNVACGGSGGTEDEAQQPLVQLRFRDVSLFTVRRREAPNFLTTELDERMEDDLESMERR